MEEEANSRLTDQRPEDTSPSPNDLSRELVARCEAAKISVERIGDEENEPTRFSVVMPSGRQKRRIVLRSGSAIRTFLDVPFEKYTVLGNYYAICSYEQGMIEGLIRTPPMPGHFVWRRLFGEASDAAEENAESPRLCVEGPDSLVLHIGKTSRDLRAFLPSFLIRRTALAIRIEGLNIRSHAAALSALERIANSMFFQVETSRRVLLSLRQASLRRRVFREPRDGSLPLEFPRTEYDKAPLSLYWYAREANGMPLLQYLACYQCIEFYFPVYSEAESRRRIKNLLKDPTFRSDREADLARVLAAAGRGGRPGEERAQLKATINECIDAVELREFIEADPDRREFFRTKASGLTDRTIPVNNPTADLRNDIADRIYDIRCRVVHTKSGSGGRETELLLPGSLEAEQMGNDVALLFFVARKVLIAASIPMRLS